MSRGVDTIAVVLAAVLGAVAPPARGGVPPAGAVPAPDAYSAARGAAVFRLSKPAATYAANCAGCHGHTGRSVEEFPTLVDRIGYFTRNAAGRAYLAEVPGVAMSAVSDADLAEMLNWLLRSYSAAQLPAGFEDYTAAEVAALRQARIIPRVRRREVIDGLVADGLIPSADVLAWGPR